jgi:hypothetical protein
VLSTIAVIVVVGSVAIFGAVQDDDPETRDIAALINAPPTTVEGAPTTTLGDSLGETIPGISDRLTLIVIGDNGPAALLWDPSFILPKELPLDTDPMDDAVYSASFDSGGRFIALAVNIPGSVGATVSVGVPSDVGDPEIADVDSYVWHATEVGHFAWISPGSDGENHLFTGEANPIGKSLTSVLDLGVVDDDETLVRWDAKGFILDARGLTTVLRSQDGSVSSSFDGTVIAASATSMVTAPAGMNPDRLTLASMRTRTGEITETIFSEGFSDIGEEIDERIRTFSMSRNSDLVARIDMTSTRTRLEVQGPSLSAIRILQHNDDVPPIGFTSNDRFFVFASDGGNDLVFVDWNLGSIHELSIPDQYNVIAFDIG